MASRKVCRLSLFAVSTLVLIFICLTLSGYLIVVLHDREQYRARLVDLGQATNHCSRATPVGFGGIEVNNEREDPVTDANEQTPRPVRVPSEVFSDLTIREYRRVARYLYQQKTLNLSNPLKAGMKDNAIYLIERWLPAKHRVLRHLDGRGPLPERKARVVLLMGARQPPVVQEYIVSPLSHPRRHRELVNPRTTHPIPWHVRPMLPTERKALHALLTNISTRLKPLLNDSFGATHGTGCGNKCLYLIAAIPHGMTSGSGRQSWIASLRNNSHGEAYLNPTELCFLVDHTSQDPSQFAVRLIVYNNQTFHSVDELLYKYNKNTINKIKMAPMSQGATYDSPLPRGKGKLPEGKKTSVPPLWEEPLRNYRVNGNYIQYRDWTLYARIQTMTGPQLLDVRFRGQRLAYEVSLQDVVVLYSGYHPTAMFSRIFDTSMVLGSIMQPLVRGVDCPHTAHFMDHSFFLVTHKTRIHTTCVFEHDTGTPTRRHFSPKYFSGFKGNSLVIRSVITAGNYDYMFDFHLHSSGAFGVEVSSSGSILTFPSSARESNYGHVINRRLAAAANIHQHLFCFKIDLDIMGTKNRQQTLDIVGENITNPWNPGHWHEQMKMVTNLKRTEKKALVTETANKHRVHLIYSDTEKNEHGSHRAYQIKTDSSSKVLISKAQSRVPWAHHVIAFTKHNEHERSVGSLYTAQDPYNPVVDFDRFTENDDSLLDTDIVSWVTVGIVHVPTMEDIPFTSTIGKRLSIMVLPHNYFDEDPTMSSPDSVYIHLTGPGHSDVISDRQCTNMSYTEL